MSFPFLLLSSPRAKCEGPKGLRHRSGISLTRVSLAGQACHQVKVTTVESDPDDLRMLERFQHASRKAPPQVRDATVAWYDPESGLDLFPYASCGTAALEWGLTPEIVRSEWTRAGPNMDGNMFLGIFGSRARTSPSLSKGILYF